MNFSNNKDFVYPSLIMDRNHFMDSNIAPSRFINKKYLPSFESENSYRIDIDSSVGYCDPHNTYLNLTVVLDSRILGVDIESSYYSIFDNIRIYSANVLVEEIKNIDKICSILFDCKFSNEDRKRFSNLGFHYNQTGNPILDDIKFFDTNPLELNNNFQIVKNGKIDTEYRLRKRRIKIRIPLPSAILGIFNPTQQFIPMHLLKNISIEINLKKENFIDKKMKHSETDLINNDQLENIFRDFLGEDLMPVRIGDYDLLNNGEYLLFTERTQCYKENDDILKANAAVDQTVRDYFTEKFKLPRHRGELSRLLYQMVNLKMSILNKAYPQRKFFIDVPEIGRDLSDINFENVYMETKELYFDAGIHQKLNNSITNFNIKTYGYHTELKTIKNDFKKEQSLFYNYSNINFIGFCFYKTLDNDSYNSTVISRSNPSVKKYSYEINECKFPSRIFGDCASDDSEKCLEFIEEIKDAFNTPELETPGIINPINFSTNSNENLSQDNFTLLNTVIPNKSVFIAATQIAPPETVFYSGVNNRGTVIKKKVELDEEKLYRLSFDRILKEFDFCCYNTNIIFSSSDSPKVFK